MIVKIQRSLCSSEGGAFMLIYNQSRSLCIQQPLDTAVKKLLAGRPKGYFKARLKTDGTLEILGRAADQGW